MIRADAFHLPALDLDRVTGWDVRRFGDEVELRTPLLDASLLEGVLERLRAARARALADRPVAELVDIIDRAAGRLADERDPLRRQAEGALPAITGYSPPMVRLIVERMARDWRADALHALLAAELGDARVLDGLRPDPAAAGRHRRAYGPELAFHVFAGNVPGVAVTSLVRSLLVKAATLGKTASGEPLLAALFARALAEVDQRLGECLAVTYWPGGTEALERLALESADLVVVYGGEETVAALRGRLPAGKRLVVHGPRLSFGVIGRESLGREQARHVAARAARAVAVFDQQGCVSPHVLYVERGGGLQPDDFAALLAEELARLEEDLPRGRLSPAEAAAIQHARSAAEFRGMAGRTVRLFASSGTEYTVLYDDDPALTPSCLNRVVWVKPLEDLFDLADLVRPFAGRLQTAAAATTPERLARLAEALGRVGISRITDLERMPWPPVTWHHDGQEPLRELIRWVDLEV